VLLARLGEADARGLARGRGASSMLAWLRGSHRLSCAEASRLIKTARALRGQLSATATAMTDGDVNLGQAEVIVDSVKDLSPGIDPELRAEGERALIGACGVAGPGQARAAGPPAGGTAGSRRGAGPRRGQDP